jgi:hypothetical protein
MKNLIAAFLLTLFATSCGNNDQPLNNKEISKKYDPSLVLSDLEEDSLIYSIARYVAPLPKKANHNNKFDTAFDTDYWKISQNLDLIAYHVQDGTTYFLISRIAPSLKSKWVATGGKFIKSSSPSEQFESYEEVFRTWKMEEPEFSTKALMLFDLMIKGEDLSRFYTENSGEDYYIEFPDANVIYNKEERRWLPLDEK